MNPKVFDDFIDSFKVFSKKFHLFLNEDILRFIFEKNLLLKHSFKTQELIEEKPYIIKEKSTPQIMKNARKGIIDISHSLVQDFDLEKSRMRLDLFVEKEGELCCFELKYFKHGYGWAPGTNFGEAINDLHRLSLLKQINKEYECYFIYAFDKESANRIHFKELNISKFIFCESVGKEYYADKLEKDLSLSGYKINEIKSKSISSFKNSNINQIQREILKGIKYKIIARASTFSIDLVVVEINNS